MMEHSKNYLEVAEKYSHNLQQTVHVIEVFKPDGWGLLFNDFINSNIKTLSSGDYVLKVDGDQVFIHDLAALLWEDISRSKINLEWFWKQTLKELFKMRLAVRILKATKG